MGPTEFANDNREESSMTYLLFDLSDKLGVVVPLVEMRDMKWFKPGKFERAVWRVSLRCLMRHPHEHVKQAIAYMSLVLRRGLG